MKIYFKRTFIIFLSFTLIQSSFADITDLSLLNPSNKTKSTPTYSQMNKNQNADPVIEAQAGSSFSNKVIDYENQNQIAGLTVFGESLFSSQCASLPQIALYNPQYLISIGDQISLTMWGAFEFSETLTVDSQGNIFVPKVGPVHVANIPNKDLNKTINSALKSTFEKNVSAYANLLSAQPIQVFVSGYVTNPGMFDGISSDSVLYFLCKAGGIISSQGSFREINLVRHGKVISTIDLYDFLLDGIIPYAQLQQGDSIVVKPVTSIVSVLGNVRVPARYEPKNGEFSLKRLINLSGVLPDATYVLIENNRGLNPVNNYIPLAKIGDRTIKGGETITLTSDQNIKEITISVTGSIYGPHQFVVPIGTTLGDIQEKIKFRKSASVKNLQLYRESVALKQKEAIESSLNNLERMAYTNSAITKDGAEMQTQYAGLVSAFVEKARKVEPKGQVIVGPESQWKNLVMQNNDVIHVPNKTLIVTVNGEVMVPTALSVQKGETVEDYIKSAGGLSPNGDDDSVLILRENGTVQNVSLGFFSTSVELQGGDQIVVPPKTMSETLPIIATISQIIFQIAIAARVVLNPT